MTVLLAGSGAYDFPIEKGGRIEYEAVAHRIGPVPSTGLRLDCLAMVVLDPAAVHDFGNGVAAGVMLPGGKAIPAGWFNWKHGRRYRAELALLRIAPEEGVLCLGRLHGGGEVQLRNGPKRLPFRLSLDLDWPIRLVDDWYSVCRPFILANNPGLVEDR
jgi:hypothetical protein